MRATEPTLKQELAPILAERIGATFVVETSHRAGGGGQPDTILTFRDCRLVLELEVGESQLLTGVAQADRYVRDLSADGSITIAYPNSVRCEVETRQDVADLVTSTNFAALVLTPFLRQHFRSITFDEFCNRFRQARSEPQPTDLDLVVSVLRQAVESLSLKLRRGRAVQRPALERVVSQFELFSTLAADGEEADPEALEIAASDLAAYVVVNQILLYFLLRDFLELPEFLPVNNTSELRRFFDRVTAVDYRAVYLVDIVSELPRYCLPEVNKIILAFRQLKPEGMQHDLLGRMFHEFLPFKTRKLFATFYTKPVAAELLARLAIDSAPRYIVEPSCGSGTLLVAAYKTLRRRNPQLSHNQALQRIYAVDIMPFAAHLAALNLTLQDLTAQTERVNAGIANSLNLAPGEGIYATQRDLFERLFSRRVDVDRTHEEELSLPRQAALVIMNPPFTTSNRLTSEMLGSRFGAFNERQNYWAYFLSLADGLLAPGGVIAAVLPRLFLAGSTSREVRRWIFNDQHYDLLYIVRTTKEFAFSEAAAFRDFLVVLQKPSEAKRRLPPCRVIYLNRSIDEISIAEAGDIADAARQIRVSRNHVETVDFTMFTVPQETIRSRSENLWFMVGFENPRNAEIISRLWARMFEIAGPRLVRLREALGIRAEQGLRQLIPRGFEAQPAGLYETIFAVRPLARGRVGPSDMVINDETATLIKCAFRNHQIKLPKSSLVLAIKTAAYFRRFEIVPHYGDWVLKERCDASRTLQRLSDVRVDYVYVHNSIEKCKTHLLAARRLNVVAPGSTFLAFFSDTEVVSPKTFYSVKCSPPQALALCLWMNSIFGVIQFLSKRMETEGGYCEVLKEDLVEFFVPSEQQIPQRLSTWYRENRARDFQSLAEQFTSRSDRRTLDFEIMRWMGWPQTEIDSDLDTLYSALASEFQLLRSAGISAPE
jgi:tRNA1(Val) A37 N6-methylase TrmN6